MKTRGLSVKNVVAIGIGSAIYVILARFTSIPTPIPNTNIELVFPFLALLAAIYGAKVGFAVGFIKGMVIVWLLLALTSLFAASEIGRTMTAYINDSMMLKYLYENNPVIKLIENIL